MAKLLHCDNCISSFVCTTLKNIFILEIQLREISKGLSKKNYILSQTSKSLGRMLFLPPKNEM